jgi:hypothetical protein
MATTGLLEIFDLHRSQIDDKHRAAIIIQKLWRGYLKRKHVKIHTLADGIVHVAIHGDSELLSSIGVDDIETAGPKNIDYVSIDPSKFDMLLAGGDKKYKFHEPSNEDPMAMRGISGLRMLKQLFDESHPARAADDHVIINGGFFNVQQQTSREAPSHAPIGKAHIVNKDTITESLPIPKGYEEYFTEIDFPDGSKLTSGPELYREGEVRFSKELLGDPRFQWRNRVGFTPGMLRHAQDPNQRSAIVLPGKNNAPEAEDIEKGIEGKGDRFRVVLASADAARLGPDRDGLSMAELAMFAQKMARMNSLPGSRAINLDGGASSQLFVLHRTVGPWRVKLLDLPKKGLPVAANFIIFSKRKTPS